jgi:3-O-methylgallate 3,4-dioxygenase
MATIVLGMATSHGPMLSTPPEQWGQRVVADKANRAHPYRGMTCTFDELVALRTGENLAKQLSPEIWRQRHAACRDALSRLAAVYQRVKPDVVVVVGNDQMELFSEENIPAFAVYWGETIQNQEYDQAAMAKLPPGIPISVPGHIPPGGATYEGHPDLGSHIIQSVIHDGFDVAALRRFPVRHQTIPHAYGFVYRQLMGDQVVPSVPVFLNTFYPPNQPSAERCRAFGEAILRAIQSWPSENRIALIASGGLSHFVIDESFDRMALDAFQRGELDELVRVDESIYRSGTSEVKNWIPVAQAMAELDWPMQLVDYIPCYRSEAGTGNAMAFAYWEPRTLS